MKQLIVSLIFGATAITGCGGPEEASRELSAVTLESHRSDEDIAAETLDRMLEAAATGDWETYVDKHYGEQHKFRSPADRDALVTRFEEKWGEQIVQALSRAAKLPAQIDQDRAMFLDGDDTVFVLYRSEDGGWKFHL